MGFIEKEQEKLSRLSDIELKKEWEDMTMKMNKKTSYDGTYHNKEKQIVVKNGKVVLAEEIYFATNTMYSNAMEIARYLKQYDCIKKGKEETCRNVLIKALIDLEERNIRRAGNPADKQEIKK